MKHFLKVFTGVFVISLIFACTNTNIPVEPKPETISDEHISSDTAFLSNQPFVGKQGIRLMAANLTSGNGQDYTDGKGLRIIQSVSPDIVMIQEFAYKTDSVSDYQEFSNLALYKTTSPTTSAYFYNEPNHNIPNAIISRYPIKSSGEWDDTYITDRDFVWAQIDIPGDNDLWVVSLHIKASTGSVQMRLDEATLLVQYLTSKSIPATDYIALGGDFNTYSNDPLVETCLGELKSFISIPTKFPCDLNMNIFTNTSRTSPYDRVLVDSDLGKYEVPVHIGTNSFTYGFIADTRYYDPISDLIPAEKSDSWKFVEGPVTGTTPTNMQHMGVVREFILP